MRTLCATGSRSRTRERERERDGCNNHQQDYETSQDENGSHSDVAFVAISLNDNFKTAGTTM